jgi:type II secretory pathway component PulM
MNRSSADFQSVWNKRAPRERLIALATAIVLAIALLQQAVWTPYQSFQESLDSRLQAKSIQLAKAEGLRKSGRSLGAPPIDPSLAGLLREIETIAAQSSVQQLDVKPLSPEDRGVEDAQAVELQLKPGIASFVRFLHDLQQSPRLMRIHSLSWTNEGTRISMTVSELAPSGRSRRRAS